MKPAFALHLDHDRITLLHRSGSGWARVGAVALTDTDLDSALAGLRMSAPGAGTGALTCKLVLPASQILYRAVIAPGPDARARKQQIRAALEGMTPYAVDDLVFDWSGTGESVQIAVVARETLDEAEEFAVSHRFGPVSFVASPDPGQFAGEPFFGQTRIAGQILPDGERVLRDNEPVVLPALTPDETIGRDGVDEPEAGPWGDAGDAQAAPPDAEASDLTGGAPAPPAVTAEAVDKTLSGPTTGMASQKAVTSGRIDTSPRRSRPRPKAPARPMSIWPPTPWACRHPCRPIRTCPRTRPGEQM